MEIYLQGLGLANKPVKILLLRDQGHHQKAHSCLMRSLEAFEQLNLPQIAATVRQALQTL